MNVCRVAQVLELSESPERPSLLYCTIQLLSDCVTMRFSHAENEAAANHLILYVYTADGWLCGYRVTSGIT